MKRLLAAIVAVAGFAAVPNTAQAEFRIHVGYTNHYVSGRASCGCPIYTKRICRGYDRCGRPIFSHYRQPFRCGCSRSRSHYYHQRSYNGCNSYRPHGYHSYHRGSRYGSSYGVYRHGRHPNSYSRSRCR